VKRNWVVVTLGSECEVYPGGSCVMGVFVDVDGLPFASKEEANAEAARHAEWERPHTMRFTENV